MLESIESQSQPNPDAAVIWLHGLGADGNDFAPIVPQLGIAAELRVRFIFPHAPKQPVTINNGFVMRAWYDVKTPVLLQQQDAKGIKASQKALIELIRQQQEQGIDSKRIILVGFSQGGAIALYTGLRLKDPLGGILSLSSYLPLADTTAKEASEENQGVSIMMAHGNFDPVIPLQAGQESLQQLQALGYQPEWFSYPMEHSVCIEEIQEIGRWINRCLKPH